MSLPTRPAHDGIVQNKLNFTQACVFVSHSEGVVFTTATGVKFKAKYRASVTRGEHLGEPVIIFTNLDGDEHARAYSCCWGHEVNCNRTWISMYSSALVGH